MRAEVNARRKWAPSQPETGSDVIKPEIRLEMLVILTLSHSLMNFHFSLLNSFIMLQFMIRIRLSKQSQRKSAKYIFIYLLDFTQSFSWISWPIGQL